MIALLFALAINSQILGNQTQILGTDDGFFTNYATLGGSAPVPTNAALPFTRTVTCTGSITITGSATNTPTSVTWAASPDGASGSCTGTSSYSCAVAVAPNAAGEGVETITITATNAFGSNNAATVDVGFYVNGAHSCFSAQNIDGSYNATLANNDPITTWTNVGSSALNVTQATAAAKPTYKTSLGTVSQPFVSFDGGDNLRDATATASNWNFINNSTECSTESVSYSATDTATFMWVWTTFLTSGGAYAAYDYRTTTNSLTHIPAYAQSSGVFPSSAIANRIQLAQALKNTIDANDAVAYLDGTSNKTMVTTTQTNSTTYLQIGGYSSSPINPLTGYIWSVRFYSTQLSATQRAINEAVDAWALNGTFPITP